ncbi:hypothetical protein M378DRAFT_161066 [Amanita muscaria Koide BX008]|uniref:Uncharacterized protein n=1 Tax=Amanita muscaria (strain Koide BX008) TaxID=946122 RepID=A0A0C2XBK0_AMAMK|nr:hypothetical protein M378DRAFT_161066 [Amanita muscaria Koide BX008]
MADLSLPYVHQFQEHLAQVRSHLSGEANDVLPSSFIAPATYWTSSEKQAFFHALARYSRLNPDLIAAHIKTKSVVDVCVYIEQLEAASRADPVPWNRTEQDIAFEVSDEWIGFEERSATALIVAEPIAHDKQRKSMRQTELDKKRTELGQAGTSDAFDTWRQDIEAQWGREDLLERLDTLKLKILESILRTGAPVSPHPVADNALGSTVLDPAQTNAISGSETLRNEDIARSSSPVHSVSPTADTEQHTLNTSGDDKLTRAEHPSSQGIVTPAMELEELAYEDLSPADRRRMQRRLYMRRRRAKQTGAEVNYTTARLRQGRKPAENPARRRVGVGGKARIYHQEVFLCQFPQR